MHHCIINLVQYNWVLTRHRKCVLFHWPSVWSFNLSSYIYNLIINVSWISEQPCPPDRIKKNYDSFFIWLKISCFIIHFSSAGFHCYPDTYNVNSPSGCFDVASSIDIYIHFAYSLSLGKRKKKLFIYFPFRFTFLFFCSQSESLDLLQGCDNGCFCISPLPCRVIDFYDRYVILKLRFIWFSLDFFCWDNDLGPVGITRV